VECPIGNLRFNIHGLGRVYIWETPHFRYLDSDRTDDVYQQYIEAHYGIDEVRNSISRFDALPNLIERGEVSNVLLGRIHRPLSSQIIVIDGTHRAAWAAYERKQLVTVAVTDQ
jgi:hypothetical protein